MNTILDNIQLPNSISIIGDDLLVGAAQIAGELGVSIRRANNLCAASAIPAFKLGGIWHARRSTLVSYIEARERDAIRGNTSGEILW
jgi:hypothetical protein